VTAFSDLNEASERCLCFYVGSDGRALRHLNDCVVLTDKSVTSVPDSVTRIISDYPKLAFYIIVCKEAPSEEGSGVHATAVIDEFTSVDSTASIGAYSIVEKSEIGPGCRIESHVVLRVQTLLTGDVTIEPNTTIGATGQVWAWGLDGKKWIPPQLGGTEIGFGVFIGSNVTIVRGALQNTVIGDKSQIAHGTRIGHNCRIGSGTFISSQVAIPGSVTIGENCFVGSGAVFRPGVSIGDNVIVGAGSVVTKDFPKPGAVLVGAPARVVKYESGGDQLAGIPVRNDLG
jgi:UDP-3-O-[3-hydroxymyristoyl] glucosamine N-acyltransferase